MKVVHYYARYLEHPSGVTDSIENWARLARRSGYDVEILSAAVASPRELPADLRDVARTVSHVGRGRTSWVPTGLARSLAPGDVVYLHEGWVVSNAVAARQARRRGASVVTMPHGVYETGVTSGLRDVVGARLAVERAALERADWLHVFYPSEADLVDGVAPRRTARTLVLPNGAPDTGAVPRWCGGGGFYLWMGRYDPDHKGIDNLLRRWAELPAPQPRLVLAGPDFRGGRGRVAELVRELGLGDRVEVRANATGEEKDRLIRECRAYLHPSRWESCSILLLEMLAAGVPTLVSATIHAASPFAAAGVSVVYDFGRPGGLGASLGLVDENRELGQTARKWVSETATWDRLGDEYGAWLAGVAEGAAR